MKTLSERHLEQLHKINEEKNLKKKGDFIDKLKMMLEKYNCTSMKELNDESAVMFIQEMINEPEVTVLNEDQDDSKDITDREYLEHTILSSSDPEKVAKAEEMLANLDDEDAESMQNGATFCISKDGENIEVTQTSFNKETGIFTGLIHDMDGNNTIEYTADDIIGNDKEFNESISKETALKIFEYYKLTGELPEEISAKDFDNIINKYASSINESVSNDIDNYLQTDCVEWKKGHANEDDTYKLTNILDTKFPDVPYENLFKKAKGWTGYKVGWKF